MAVQWIAPAAAFPAILQFYPICTGARTETATSLLTHSPPSFVEVSRSFPDHFFAAMPTSLPFSPGGTTAAGAVMLLVLFVGILTLWRRRTGPSDARAASTRPKAEWESAIEQALWTFGTANADNLGSIPPRTLSRVLRHYTKLHPQDGLTLQTSPAALKLDNYYLGQRFFGHWKAAWEISQNDIAFASVTSRMVDELCKFLGLVRVDERAYKGLIGYIVRAPSLRLNIPGRFPIIFMPQHEMGERELRTLRDLMGILNMTSFFALVIDLRIPASKDLETSLKHLVREAVHDFIVLDQDDMKSLLASRDHSRRLLEIILSQVDLAVVSPYVTSGPVPENMFFGRDHEIKTILRTLREVNFAIVGGRKIGKTSLLARVHRLLQETPDFHPLYLDCQAVRTHADLFEAIFALWRISFSPPAPEGFRRMAIELSNQYPDRVLVLLFDEIDALLRYDVKQGEPLFRIMRTLSQEYPIRFIFCGEKLLNSALRNPNLAFYNFCNVLPLRQLAAVEARRVIVEPMQEMDIALERGPEMADQITLMTGAHPNALQYFCQQLIERINERHERVITQRDVSAVGQSAQFAEYLASVSWGNANALERLITLLMLDRPEVTPAEMADLLRAHNIQINPAQLSSAFEGLVLYAILSQDGPKFAFSAEALPSSLRKSQDIEGLRSSLLAQLCGRGA